MLVDQKYKNILAQHKAFLDDNRLRICDILADY